MTAKPDNIEMGIAKDIGLLLYEQMRESNENISVNINNDRIVVVVPKALSEAERYLVQNSNEPSSESLMRLKEKVIADLTPALGKIVFKNTGIKVKNMHSSINIDKGERLLFFSLEKNYRK